MSDTFVYALMVVVAHAKRRYVRRGQRAAAAKGQRGIVAKRYPAIGVVAAFQNGGNRRSFARDHPAACAHGAQRQRYIQPIGDDQIARRAARRGDHVAAARANGQVGASQHQRLRADRDLRRFQRGSVSCKSYFMPVAGAGSGVYTVSGSPVAYAMA